MSSEVHGGAVLQAARLAVYGRPVRMLTQHVLIDAQSPTICPFVAHYLIYITVVPQ